MKSVKELEIEENEVEKREEVEKLELTDEKKEIFKIKNIEIFPYQKEHFKRILEILQNELGYLDVSPFGSGKTIISLAVAVKFKMGIIVVGPKTVLSNWKYQSDRKSTRLNSSHIQKSRMPSSA